MYTSFASIGHKTVTELNYKLWNSMLGLGHSVHTKK